MLRLLARELRDRVASSFVGSKIVPDVQQLRPAALIRLVPVHFLNDLVVVGEEPSLNPERTRYDRMSKVIAQNLNPEDKFRL